MNTRLIVGLGNPGPEYVSTRHNVGFMVIQHLLDHGVRKVIDYRRGMSSHIWRVQLCGKAVSLQMPLTFMNLSGDAVAKVCRSGDVAPQEVLVVYDDVDLPLGRLRLRSQGGSGGHRGVESIIGALGSAAFGRLRVGIGRGTGGDTADYVLAPFLDGEKQVLGRVLEAASDAVMVTLRRGLQAAMGQYNGVDLAEKSEQNEERCDGDQEV